MCASTVPQVDFRFFRAQLRQQRALHAILGNILRLLLAPRAFHVIQDFSQLPDRRLAQVSYFQKPVQLGRGLLVKARVPKQTAKRLPIFFPLPKTLPR